MKINRQRLDFVLAEQCKAVTDLRQENLSAATLTRIRKGLDVSTRTAGKLARVLGVPLERLIETEAK
jgi:hypothetical protein